MAWKAVHPSLTEEVRIPEDGPTFTIGFWPPREAERLRVVWARLKKPDEELDPIKDFDRLVEKGNVGLDLYRAMCRWGVRGWTGFGDVSCSTEEIEIDGRKHPSLTPEGLDAMYVNQLLVAVGLRCMAFNFLTEDQRGKLDWRSGSSTTSHSTNAAGAAPATHPKTTEPSSSG